MEHKYNWKDYPEINNLLDELYENTLNENKNKDDLSKVIQLLGFLEDYILYLTNYYNGKKIISALEKIKSIKITQSSVPVYILGSMIMIDEKLLKEDSKDKKNIVNSHAIYYLYYELTKRILNFKSEVTEKFSKIYSYSLQGYDKKIETQVMVNNGWLFLEDVIARDVAERLTCIALDKIRLSTKISFDYYYAVVFFAMSLNNVATLDNHSTGIVMFRLLKKVFNTDFSKEVIDEYISSNNEFELYEILYIMGLIINNQNHCLPYINLTNEEIEDLFNELNKLLFGLINFEKKEVQPVESIEEKRLNPFEKMRILRLIRDKKV